jgi:hypothetical protein
MRQALVVVFLVISSHIYSQELFIATEPASNMPKGSSGIRVAVEGSFMNDALRTRSQFEVMYGFSKEIMLHGELYASDHLGTYAFENAGVYAKYRFFTDDDFKYHFRSALYAKALFGSQNGISPLVGLDGASPGYGGGIVSTLLVDHLAVSVTLGAVTGIPEIENEEHIAYHDITNYNYSLSAGYLVYPAEYVSYSDPNFNIYAEVLGKYGSYTIVEHEVGIPGSANEVVLSVGPQVILNSIARIDLAFKTTLLSNAPHRSPNAVYLKFERLFY